MLSLIAAALIQTTDVGRACTAEELSALTAPDPAPYRLTCFATLPRDATVSRRVVIEGAEASGAGIDCAGAVMGRPGTRSTTGEPTVAIWSRRSGTGWSVPSDVRIVGCVIHGNVRIWGAGLNDMDGLRASSRTRGHTAATQSAAPRRIRFRNVVFDATGSIPLYVGPGTTGVEVTGGAFRGRSVSVAVYLDAESMGAVIRNVRFDIATGREQIAVDGSANNRIEHNHFRLGGRGGVFLYRNCGEDGVIRHQTPSGNTIADNHFEGVAWLGPQAVVVGAREGRRRYCGDDAGYPFGSSLDNGDHATGNVVRNNTTLYRWLPRGRQTGRGSTRLP